ncbi:hypothetical protein BDP27DRAFT_1428303 [Rhodocollybia butyracea]|uniref:Uncharacterized protein n=1 Tax=Rhodocollybia butyracea TaxID=206335 RepID=A0A9P5U008_9AGAR|nr:hypothetical protein BDP27DRAFT_1428303 [Rhodocollybia butyracea]
MSNPSALKLPTLLGFHIHCYGPFSANVPRGTCVKHNTKDFGFLGASGAG